MAEIASSFVSLMPSAKGFGSGIEKQIGGDLDKAGKSSGKRFGTALKFGAVAVLGGAAALGGFLKGSLDEAREAQKVGALTAQVIKSTGGAANITAKQVGKLSGAISAQTGIDDEVIQSGANMLLTFKNIRNEAGKGNDVFSQSTKTLTDMSAAMGTEPKQAAIQLGKALNDPIKGITALSRVGVTFTDGQKKQIETLVKSGKTMDAQKIILKELNSEFGGAAAAQATAGDKARVALGNLQETVGTALLPVWDKMLDGFTRGAVFLTNNVGPAFSKVGKFLAPVKSAVESVAASFSGGSGGGLLSVLTTASDTFRNVVLPAVTALASYLVGKLAPIFQQVAGIIANQVVPIATRLATFFYGTLYPAVFAIVAAIGKSLKPVLDALFKVIQDSVLPTVRKLLAKFQEWQPTLEKVIKVVLIVVGAVLRLAAAILGKVLPPLIRFAGFLIKVVVGAVVGVIDVVIKVIGWIIKFGAAVIEGGRKVADFAKKVIDLFRGLPGRVARGLGDIGSALVEAGKDLIQGLINGVKAMAGSVAKAAGDVVGSAIDAAKRKLGIHSPSKVFHEIGINVGKGFEGGLRQALGKARDYLTDALQDSISQLRDFRSAARDLAGSVASNFQGDALGGNLTTFADRLKADTDNAKAFAAALDTAAKNGLDGRLFQELAQSGNLDLAQQFADQTKSGIRQYEEMFAARERAARRLGQGVGDEVFGGRIGAQAAEIRGLRADLKEIIRKQRQIVVNDRSGDPKRTAQEVVRREAWAGAS